MSLGNTVNAVVTTVENDTKVIFKDVKTALTTDIGPATTATKGAVGSLLIKRVNPFAVFGVTIPVNKKYAVKFVELASVAVLAIGLIGTQLYVFIDHKKSIELNSARVGTVEAYQKQTDTNFVNVNSAIIATNKLIASVATDQKAEDAKLAAIQNELNAKLSPVHRTSAVTRKYYRKSN